MPEYTLYGRGVPPEAKFRYEQAENYNSTSLALQERALDLFGSSANNIAGRMGEGFSTLGQYTQENTRAIMGLASTFDSLRPTLQSIESGVWETRLLESEQNSLLREQNLNQVMGTHILHEALQVGNRLQVEGNSYSRDTRDQLKALFKFIIESNGAIPWMVAPESFEAPPLQYPPTILEELRAAQSRKDISRVKLGIFAKAYGADRVSGYLRRFHALSDDEFKTYQPVDTLETMIFGAHKEGSLATLDQFIHIGRYRDELDTMESDVSEAISNGRVKAQLEDVRDQLWKDVGAEVLPINVDLNYGELPGMERIVTAGFSLETPPRYKPAGSSVLAVVTQLQLFYVNYENDQDWTQGTPSTLLVIDSDPADGIPFLPRPKQKIYELRKSRRTLREFSILPDDLRDWIDRRKVLGDTQGRAPYNIHYLQRIKHSDESDHKGDLAPSQTHRSWNWKMPGELNKESKANLDQDQTQARKLKVELKAGSENLEGKKSELESARRAVDSDQREVSYWSEYSSTPTKPEGIWQNLRHGGEYRRDSNSHDIYVSRVNDLQKSENKQRSASAEVDSAQAAVNRVSGLVRPLDDAMEDFERRKEAFQARTRDRREFSGKSTATTTGTRTQARRFEPAQVTGSSSPKTETSKKEAPRYYTPSSVEFLLGEGVEDVASLREYVGKQIAGIKWELGQNNALIHLTGRTRELYERQLSEWENIRDKYFPEVASPKPSSAINPGDGSPKTSEQEKVWRYAPQDLETLILYRKGELKPEKPFLDPGAGFDCEAYLTQRIESNETILDQNFGLPLTGSTRRHFEEELASWVALRDKYFPKAERPSTADVVGRPEPTYLKPNPNRTDSSEQIIPVLPTTDHSVEVTRRVVPEPVETYSYVRRGDPLIADIKREISAARLILTTQGLSVEDQQEIEGQISYWQSFIDKKIAEYGKFAASDDLADWTALKDELNPKPVSEPKDKPSTPGKVFVPKIPKDSTPPNP